MKIPSANFLGNLAEKKWTIRFIKRVFPTWVWPKIIIQQEFSIIFFRILKKSYFFELRKGSTG